MLDVTAPAKPTAPKAITIKILANELEEQHQLSKRQALKLMEDLIGMITKHLVVGELVKIVELGILQVRIVLPAWAAIRIPVNRSRSRPARRWPSVPARNSKRQFDRHPCTDDWHGYGGGASNPRLEGALVLAIETQHIAPGAAKFS